MHLDSLRTIPVSQERSLFRRGTHRSGSTVRCGLRNLLTGAQFLAFLTRGRCLGKLADPARVEAETGLFGALRVVRQLHDYLLAGAAGGSFGLWGTGATMIPDDLCILNLAGLWPIPSLIMCQLCL